MVSRNCRPAAAVSAGLDVSLLADLESSGMLMTVYELNMSSAASL